MKTTILLLSLLTAFAAFGQATPLDSNTTVFVGVNVIPMDRERILRNQTVIVRNGVIDEIGDAKKVRVPKGAQRQEAIAVANKLFEAMRAKNAPAIRALFMPEGQLVAIDKPRSGEGPSKTRVFSPDAFSKLISESKAPEFIEKMAHPKVEIFGDMALVFGRYTFHVGDKFSHCGTNSFHLVRTIDGWKIANAASTLEFDCGQKR